MRGAFFIQPLDALVYAIDLHFQIIPMLYTIAAILIVLWLIGLVTSYTLGGFVHLLLVIAVIVVLVRLIQGKKLIP